MDDPREGGKRKNLKEYKACHEIRREHNALGRAQCKDNEHPVSIEPFSLMGKILFGEQRRTRPHDGCDKAVDCPESIGRKTETVDEYSGNVQPG